MSSDPAPLWFLNSRVVIRRPSASSADGLSVAEHQLPFGDSPPLHVHHREDEIFHILEGVVRFRVGDGEVVVRAGESVVAPKTVPHTFRVESADGARVLVMAPGQDFEGLVRDISQPAETDGLPPPSIPSPAMVAALAEACERRGITLLGPPMAA
jgi:mannose-6-phosphate isomerase-like protein (cupin superfamily)